MSELQNTSPPRNKIANLAAVLGAMSFFGSVCCCVPLLGYIAMPIVTLLSILAIVLGSVGLSKAKQLDGEGKEAAITGLAMGFGTVLLILATIAIVAVDFYS